jgi:hypothetical protein
MDLFSLAVSGLLGAVLGSAISLGGAYRLEQWRRHRDEIGADRSLYFEMKSNAMSLKRMSEGHKLTDLTQATWDATETRVATLLSPSDFMVIALSYGMLPYSQARIDDARARGAATTSDETFWLGAAIDIQKGVIALKPVVWSDREGKALDKWFASEFEAEQAAPTQPV